MSKRNLQLLGTVRVESVDGDIPRFRSQRTVALLGYLVAERRAISRDHLAALFWPDEDLAAGKANLRRELHNLAQILPGCWQTSRVEVAFVPGEDTAVDIIQLRQYETAGQWQAAADLIGGNFLEGIILTDNLEFESWLFGEQERWRQRCQLVLHHLIDHYKKQAKFTEALVYSRQLLQLTPWNEEGHRQVMFLLARTGQRSAALKQFGQCQKLLQEEFGVEVSAETMTLYEQIRRRQTFALHNIPALTTPFIGRERELSSLEAWLEDPQTRLITIMGPGGMGKTRLALALAQREAQAWEIPEEGEVRFPDGIYFVPLATSPDAAQLVTAVARALHFSLQVSDNRPPQEQLFDYIQNKHLLLILDNLEHLLEGIRILTDFLQAAPHLQIVTTSRARLQLQGEQVLDLKGLDYKPAQSESAAQLFLEVARRVQSDLQINEESRVHLNRICTLVQGMPLALELAASWVNILSLAEIAQEIEGNLDFLETSTRDLPVRHLSIRAVFDTSWQHLAPEEQNTYSQISVFVGGFTREAAQEVCKATLTLLSRLVNHSLLQYDPERGRYQMHELLRQYANSKLSILNKSELPPRHLSYFVNLVGAQIDQSKTGHIMEFGQWEVEFDNIQAALDWSVQNPSDAVNGMKLASALEEFWLGSQYNLSQVRQWLTDLISIEDTFIPLQTMAAAFRTLGRLEYLLSRQRQVAIEYCQQSLTILERLSDDKGRILTLCSLGQIERHHYHIDIAEDYYQQAYDIATRISDLWGQSTALHGLGAIAFQRGELDIAQAFADEGFSCARELGDDGRVAHLLVVSGMIATEKRQWERARSLYEEALNVYRGINYIDGERVALAELGEIKRIECDYGEAEKLYQESLAIARDRGSPEGISIALYNLGQTLLMRNKLSQAFNFLDEGLNLAREQRDSVLTQCFIDALACLFASQRQFELALILWGAVDAAMKASSSDLDIADRLQHEHFVSMTKNVMDAAAFQNAWQKGQQMTLEEALILLKNGVATFPALL